MDTQDLPLVVFTILAQLSVGAFFVLGVIHVISERRGGPARTDKLSDPALYMIGPIMVVALCVSLAHLGYPLHAIFTLENFGRSWLSREIVFGVAFCVLSIAFSVVHQRKWFTPVLRQSLAVLTALFGIALIVVQGMIYVIPTIPAWDSWATPVSFFVTALLLGCLVVGANFVLVTSVPRLAARHGGDTIELLRHSLRWISAASLGLLGVEFVIEPTYALELAGRGAAGIQSASLQLYGGGSMLIVELALIFLGAGLIGFVLHELRATGEPLASTMAVPVHGPGAMAAAAMATTSRVTAYAVESAFVLVLAGEVLNRILFYNANVRIGFGGF